MQIVIDRFAAILFDLDGTLVDTMPLHYRAYATVLADRGLTLAKADYMALVGAPARAAIPRFLAACGQANCAPDEVAAIHLAKKAAFEAELAAAKLAPLRAFGLLRAAHGRVPTALVSSGNRAGVSALLAKMGWRDLFAVVVTGDDVAQGKPHPEPFLRAAALLGVAPDRCLVLEDTADGLASGRAAGMTAVDVTADWSFV